MSDRHGRVLLQQHERDGLAHQVAPSDDDGALARKVRARLLQHAHAAARHAQVVRRK